MEAILAIEIKQRSCTPLTGWIVVYAGNVSNVNQAKELHMTHFLNRNLCRQCQQWKSSKRAAYDSLSG
jgi:hypothetical protein